MATLSYTALPQIGNASDVAANRIIQSFIDVSTWTSAANVDTANIVNSAVTAAKLASDSVTTVKLLDANVTAGKLASDSVTTVKILDANVTTAKLADKSVTNAKLDPSLQLVHFASLPSLATLNSTWGTSLSAIPDGARITIPAAGASGGRWILEYSTADTAWMYIGGSPAFTQGSALAQTVTVTTTATAVAIAGITAISLPYAGTFIIESQAVMTMTTTGTGAAGSIFGHGNGSTLALQQTDLQTGSNVVLTFSGTTGTVSNYSHIMQRTFSATSNTIQVMVAKVVSSTTTLIVNSGSLKIIPVKITPA